MPRGLAATLTLVACLEETLKLAVMVSLVMSGLGRYPGSTMLARLYSRDDTMASDNTTKK